MSFRYGVPTTDLSDLGDIEHLACVDVLGQKTVLVSFRSLMSSVALPHHSRKRVDSHETCEFDYELPSFL